MIPRTRTEAFKVLELSEGVSKRDIKQAYYKLIRKWHPDKHTDANQEEKDKATERAKEITVAYGILIGEITEEFIEQQPNDDWANDWYKRWHGSHLSKEENDLFTALSYQDLAKTRTLLRQVENINAQEKLYDIMTTGSILHYIVKNSCSNPKSGWIELLEEVLSKYSSNMPCSQSAINVNIMDGFYKTPLYVACELGNLDVVNILLRHGADPNIHHDLLLHAPLCYTLKDNKIDIAKALLKYGAKTEGPKFYDTTDFSKSAVEVLLPYLSDNTKDMMLYSIIKNSSVENDHDIEIAKLLLNTNVNLDYYIRCAEKQEKSKLVKLLTEHKENIINNNLHHVKPPTANNTEHNSTQFRKRWIIIVPALLFGAVGATLAVMGIIPQIAAIGVIATVMLSGIVGAIVGGVTGYLVDVTISQCCSNQQCAVQ